MKRILVNFSIIIVLFVLIVPSFVSAHQPRIVKSDFVEITKPEISQAFYGELKGTSTEYRINSSIDFNLYIGLLVPDIADVRKDISAEISKVTDGKREVIAVLDGSKFTWTPFYEEFAKDNYFWGPEFMAADSQKGTDLKGQPVSAGDYRIKIYNTANQGKYSMAVGYIESFPFFEIVSSLSLVPQIKLHFFNEPLYKIIPSPFVWGSILFFYLIAFIFGFVMRVILKKLSINFGSKQRNVGLVSMFFRLLISLILLIIAINTTWNPFVIFVSGLVMFSINWNTGQSE